MPSESAMTTPAAALVEAAMPELETWIGRREVIEDDIPLVTARRAAALLDMDPDAIERGTELPRTWFPLFFASNARQRDIGPDGHPNKGLFLPPIPLPRRMAAGRRVEMLGSLRVGEPATRTAEVLAIEPKAARSGHLVVLTMRHTYATRGRIVATEEFDAVYREALPPGARNATPPAVAPPDGAAWRETVHLSNALVFRYSAITWNAHRIHYDADYTRDEEGYPALVQNGGLTMQLMLQAATARMPGPVTGFEARLVRPLWVGDTIAIEGTSAEAGRMACWGVDKSGALAIRMDLAFAA
jgi:3-methylfumaryl-CoA hydratase